MAVLVANAMVVDVEPLHETSLASWHRQLDVTLTGAFLAVQTFLSDLRATSGAVVLVSSVHALFGLPGRPAYATAKAGLTGLGPARRRVRPRTSGSTPCCRTDPHRAMG